MPVTTPQTCRLRTAVNAADSQAVRDIVSSTGFFSPAETDVAVELIEDRLSRGDRSDYHFVFAEVEDRTAGYTCFGEIACTVGSYDLYWIVVHNQMRGGGLGRRLLAETERLIAARGGRRIYIETSSRAQYEPTRQFYLHCGYRIAALLEDFYAPGDGKVVFVKALGG
jgi:GNAT superfamily N-acetyltransferase